MKTIFSKLFGSAAGLLKSFIAFPVKFIVTHPIATLVIGLLIVGGIAGGIYFGIGGGKFGIPSPVISTPVDAETPSEDPEPEIDWTEVRQLTILIEDDRVFVNDIEFEGAGELRALFNEIYDDEKIVRLNDTQSILATRDWVIEVLNGLNISYTQMVS